MVESDSFREGIFKTVRKPGALLRFETDLCHFKPIYDTPSWCRIIDGDVCLDIYYVLRRSRKIFVFGQDALIEGRSELPYFYRTSWAPELDGSFITFNDPTLYLGDRLRGGWWQLPGAIELAQSFVERILIFKDLSESCLRIFGASAGGFFALAMAGVFPQASVIADIPQVDLVNSPFAHNVDILRSAGISEMKTVFHWWSPSRPPCCVSVIFNERDVKHIRSQVEIVFNNINKLYYENSVMLRKFSVSSYANEDQSLRGHSPMEKSRIISILREL
ncbi:hypothetical protein LVO79_20690 (plasmid) [Roseivivax marinus]|uniref:hypothetical protein n=1 Tax=Roseivivax marinus TaxID=1379903 RepID=UPI001F04738B|nr:hypothetical protein [Roseivivax marinus]UMA67228.1 hypothetical protein LVO79_20690 [Roseivivax marinus]